MERLNKKVLVIIDGNSAIHRAWHALPPLTTSKGQLIQAAYGFFSVFLKILKEFQPDYLSVAFDTPGPTERHKKFKQYKAQREKAPDELYSQIILVKQVLERIKVKSFEKEGYEADDLVGTLATEAKKYKVDIPLQVIIVSGDQDAFQLVDEQTKVYTMRKGLQDTVLYDEKALGERFEGLKPQQMIDFKALRGDPSDNIPGVPGVGEKTALELLKDFGSLENIYEALEKGQAQEKIKPKIRECLREHKKQAFMSKDLVTINRKVPIQFVISEFAWKQSNKQKLREVFEEFEFHSLAERIGLRDGDGKKMRKILLQGDPEGDQQEISWRIEQLYKEGILSEQLYEIEKQIAPLLRKVEERGVKIDRPYFQKLAKDMGEALSVLRRKIYEYARKEFNLNSSQQMSEVLFEELKLSSKGLKKTPTGFISTASGELEKLRGTHPIIEETFKYREIQKLLSTYALPLPLFADKHDRVHTHFDQFGAATGRLSSSRPNLQNIPRQGEWGQKIRRGFIAEQGFFLVSFDYSQMELRIAAHLSGDRCMQEFFHAHQDIHTMTASAVFGVSKEHVTPEMRFRAKALNFGVLYGMGAPGFAKSSGVSVEEARAFIEQYFTRFSGIAAYMEEAKAAAKIHGYAQTMFGRRRYLPEMNSPSPQLRAAAERMAQNHPIQGTLADLIKMAMVRIEQELPFKESEVHMVLQIHDELLFEIIDESVQEAAKAIQRILETVCQLVVPLHVEIKKGKNWADVENIP